MAFKYDPMVLLAETSTQKPTISSSPYDNESYFNTALETVLDIKKEHAAAKLELYKGITESSTDDFKKHFSTAYERSFPKKTKTALNESCDSTEHFIRYFGKSIAILNKATGNIANSCNCIKNRVPSAERTATGIISAIKEAKEKGTCPVCKTSPCTCNGKKENLYKFDTTSLPFTVQKIDFSGLDRVFSESADVNTVVADLSTQLENCRTKVCGFDPNKVSVSEAEFGEAAIRTLRTFVTESTEINKQYMEYCYDKVLNYGKNIYAMKHEAARVAGIMQESVDELVKLVKCNETGSYVSESVARTLNEEDCQNTDLYCKAAVDTLINQCNSYLISIAAKLDALRSEYDQCKLVLSKYLCGNDQPMPDVTSAPSTDVSDPATPDAGAVSSEEPIAENPKKDEATEYGAVDTNTGSVNMRDGGDVSYTEAYESFLIDTVIKEAELTNYINTVVIGGGDYVALNEGLIASAKNGLQRVLNFIKTIWGKFINSMSALFENDQKYLADNKTIITGKKLKNVTLENWYDYNLERIHEGKVGNIGNDLYKISSASTLQITDVVRKCGDEKNGAANAFMEYFGNEYDSKSTNTVDKFKDYFRGTTRTVNASTFTQQTMQTMYDYCYNFKAETLQTITGEKDRINDIYQAALDSLTALENLVKDEEKKAADEKAKAEEQQQQNHDTEQDKQEADQARAEREKELGDRNTVVNGLINGNNSGETRTAGNNAADIADILDDYFNEEGLKVKPGGDANAKSDTTKTATSADTHNDNLNAASQADKDARADASKSVSSEDTKMLKRYYDNVFGLVKDYIASRLTCAQGAYKDYMKLIRWHVGQYKGVTKDTTGSNIDTSTATTGGDGGTAPEKDKV